MVELESLRMQSTLMIIVIIWLVVVSAILVRLVMHYKRLGKGVHQGNLLTHLESISTQETALTKEIAVLTRRVLALEKEKSSYLQKVGFHRFNPFNEIGGDQSFSLGILDGENDGIIITGLHTREKTRVYAKPVKAGKSTYELSAEEEKAVKVAQKK